MRKEQILMSTLLESKVRPEEELVRGLPGEVVESVSEQLPADPAGPPIDLIDAAYEVAKEIYGCWEFSERLEVYKSVGSEFKADARRVLNVAAARWPDLIFWVNDLPEWKALLSADLS
jgi:hypothetical protein